MNWKLKGHQEWILWSWVERDKIFQTTTETKCPNFLDFKVRNFVPFSSAAVWQLTPKYSRAKLGTNSLLPGGNITPYCNSIKIKKSWETISRKSAISKGYFEDFRSISIEILKFPYSCINISRLFPWQESAWEAQSKLILNDLVSVMDHFGSIYIHCPV